MSKASRFATLALLALSFAACGPADDTSDGAAGAGGAAGTGGTGGEGGTGGTGGTASDKICDLAPNNADCRSCTNDGWAVCALTGDGHPCDDEGLALVQACRDCIVRDGDGVPTFDLECAEAGCPDEYAAALGCLQTECNEYMECGGF